MKTPILKITILWLIFSLSNITNIFAKYHSAQFSLPNDDGITIYYNIIGDGNCEVTSQYYRVTEPGDAYSPPMFSCSYSGDVVIPETITYNSNTYIVSQIGVYAFTNCSGLTSIIIPKTITEIKKNAFVNCSNLTSVTIPDFVTTLGNDAFYGCTNLTSIVIGKSLQNVDSSAFSESNITTIITSSTLFNYSVFGSSLEEVYIHSSIVCPSCFNGVTSLKKVILGDEVTSIGEYAFCGCSELTEITFSNSLKSIECGSFESCIGLVEINIPNSVESIGELAFSGCTGLKEITIPNSVKSIGKIAFYGCTGLTKLIISDSVTNIEYKTFAGCSGLTEIVIPNSVNCVGELAFQGCTGLTKITISNSVVNIGNSAFSGCTSLNNISMSNAIVSIGNDAFAFCEKMERVDISDLEAWFRISFGNELSNPLTMGHYLNLNNQEIHDLVIPNTITTINPYVLYNATCLTSIEIPNSVTSIGEKAFYGCSNLTSVESKITDVFKTGASAFEGCNKATLYVPEGLLISYSGREDWSRIAKIQESESGIKIAMSCNSRGKVVINDETIFTKKMGEVKVLEDVDNTFEFLPNANCKLEQVLVNGFDVTASVENNKLIAPIDEGASIIVTFSKDEADINHDGRTDISDVVELVNIILGK